MTTGQPFKQKRRRHGRVGQRQTAGADQRGGRRHHGRFGQPERPVQRRSRPPASLQHSAVDHPGRADRSYATAGTAMFRTFSDSWTNGRYTVYGRSRTRTGGRQRLIKTTELSNNVAAHGKTLLPPPTADDQTGPGRPTRQPSQCEADTWSALGPNGRPGFIKQTALSSSGALAAPTRGRGHGSSINVSVRRKTAHTV